MNFGEVLIAEIGDGTVSESFGETTVDMPPALWVRAVKTARDRLGCHFFDWLTAVDEGNGGYAVVCHLWSVELRLGLLLRTLVPLAEPHLTTVTGVFAGAAWHERETYEMFGISFDGHPHLVPLLLPEGFEGHPLRKQFVLASRVAKDWPGAREPGESSTGGPARRRMRPPGVPDPADWGPIATPASIEQPLTEPAAEPLTTAADQDPRGVGAAGAAPTSLGSAEEGSPAEADPAHPEETP